MSTNPVEDSDSTRTTFSVHQFQLTLSSVPAAPEAFVQVVRFGDTSLQIWIGDQSGLSSNLAFAFPKGSSTKFLGPIGRGDDLSEHLAIKFSNKLRKPVFVGYNARFQDPESLSEIQSRISQEIKNFPEKF